MIRDIDPMVEITPVESNKVMISWRFTTHVINEATDGLHECYIPGFNVSFAAKSVEEAKNKGRALVSVMFDHYLLDEKTNGLKYLTLHLRKLGFRATQKDMIVVKNLVNRNPVRAKLTTNAGVPAGFAGSVTASDHASLELAY